MHGWRQVVIEIFRILLTAAIVCGLADVVGQYLGALIVVPFGLFFMGGVRWLPWSGSKGHAFSIGVLLGVFAFICLVGLRLYSASVAAGGA
jgi:hypothetical protein